MENVRRNTLLVMVLALCVSVFGMWRMDFLASPRSEYVRMTDSARNAYVAKNLVEGKGYTTNDIPAALIGFYQQRGKLHQEHWPNADRFPFTTFAIAALYTVTQSPHWWVGITLYNILAFTILITLIYRLSLSVFRNHFSAIAAITVALLHHGTWYLLYQKDADSVALTVGVLIALIRWLDTPRDKRTRWAPVLGTLLAWLFLARPNVGLPFLIFLLVELIKWAREKADGPYASDKLRVMLRVYGALAAGFALWTLPYAIYSMVTWGSPFFSANSLYQLPLGTRLSLGADTWWKYYGPDRVLSFSGLLAEVPGEILWKVVSSWILTFRLCLSSYITEIVVLVLAKLTIWRRGDGRDPEVRDSVRTVGRLLVIIVLFNLAILPLFGWAYFPWKQYLVFAMPWVCVFVGHAVYRFLQIARARMSKDVAGQYFWAWLGLIAVIAFIGYGDAATDGSFLTEHFTNWTWNSWRPIALVLALVLVFRPRRVTPLGSVLVAAAIVLMAHKPAFELKSDSVNYFPLSKGVQRTLKQGTGLVSSLALQSEVSWLSDRKHIPVPENALLLYKYKSDFDLDIEDIYIESAGTMIAPPGGPFSKFMPALESYGRLERYQAPLPGYEIVFHEEGTMGYPGFRTPRRPKASTIYRLTDPKARDAVQTSPDVLELGDVKNAMYVTHGFGGYYIQDGRRTVAQTNATRLRYRKPPRPYEDASLSFYLSDRLPTKVSVSLYVLAGIKLDVFWNLDLDAYDRSGDRTKHKIGTISASTTGWQTVTFEIPRGLPRKGLNKLGVRTSIFVTAAGCLAGTEFCATQTRDTSTQTGPLAPLWFASVYGNDVGQFQLSSLFESIKFEY